MALFSAKELRRFTILAVDGEMGKVRDLLFDDEHWAVRHLVADTGGWLTGRQVLVSPHAVEAVHLEEGCVQVALTRRQVEDAPGVETDQPVSRQHEQALYDYYAYPYYWVGGGVWGAAGLPLPSAAAGRAGAVMGAAAPDQGAPPPRAEGDPHLRSCTEVMGYRIEASDGAIGHVEDFLFDLQSWNVRYLVVDTRSWLPGRRVLVEPGDIRAVDWNEREVRVRLTRQQVKSAPEPQQAS